MSVARCTAVNPAPGTTLFTVDSVQKGKLTNITIDNQGAAANTIIFRDSFTTDVSQLAAAAPVTKILKQVTVASGLTASLDTDELKDVEVFGALQCYASATDATCVITVAYHEE